jgi:hypothetical protein
MRANPLRGQVGGGWTLQIEIFLGPALFTGPYQSEVPR